MVLRPKSLFQSDTFFPEGSKERLFSCFLQFQALEAAYIQAPSCLEPAGAMRVFTPQSLWWWLFFCLLACTRTPCYFPRTFLICAQNDPTLTALKTRLWEPGAERLAVKENPLLTHFLAPHPCLCLAGGTVTQPYHLVLPHCVSVSLFSYQNSSH